MTDTIDRSKHGKDDVVGGLINGETRDERSSAEQVETSNKVPSNEGFDKKQKFIHVDKDGWITARVNLERGFYDIIGFLKEVEDTVRNIIVQARKAEQEKKIIKSGFRGFNPFKRG